MLLENEAQCGLQQAPIARDDSNSNVPTFSRVQPQIENSCLTAAKINAPNYDSPCYNGGLCSPVKSAGSNFTCTCLAGFAGSLCETNIDDCLDHQCQNGAMCVDGINSYKCVCRDPTTSGDYCEQLNNAFTTNSANSIAPMALPMIASTNSLPALEQPQQQQTMLARSVDFYQLPNDLSNPSCKRITQRKYYEDGNGCQSIRMLKMSICGGSCNGSASCCVPAVMKRRRIRLQCNDGASYVKTIDLIKKCSCSNNCNDQQQLLRQNQLTNQFNATQEDQLLQITRLDAVD